MASSFLYFYRMYYQEINLYIIIYKKMRITSPKNIPLPNKQSINCPNQPKLSKKPPGLNINNQKFHSYHTSRHDSKMQFNEEYKTKDQQSNLTQQFFTRSKRSKSRNGISISRDKTIKIDNIYQPQHFGQKNLENVSTKSNTQGSKNAKSTSRLTRATSPTVTYFPQQKQETSIGRTLNSFNSMKQIGQKSLPIDNFDFTQLKKQITNSNKPYQNSMKLLPQEEQYYSGQTYQLNQNIYENKNKIVNIQNQNNHYQNNHYQNQFQKLNNISNNSNNKSQNSVKNYQKNVYAGATRNTQNEYLQQQQGYQTPKKAEENFFKNKNQQYYQTQTNTSTSNNRSNKISSFSIENKVNKTVSLWVKKPGNNLNSNINGQNNNSNQIQNEYNINNYQMGNYQEQTNRQSNSNKGFQGSTTNGSVKDIGQDNHTMAMGINRVGSTNRLNWKDVIKK